MHETSRARITASKVRSFAAQALFALPAGAESSDRQAYLSFAPSRLPLERPRCSDGCTADRSLGTEPPEEERDHALSLSRSNQAIVSSLLRRAAFSSLRGPVVLAALRLLSPIPRPRNSVHTLLVSPVDCRLKAITDVHKVFCL